MTERETGLLRLKGVLKLFPVSASTLWRDVRAGRFPKPIKISERITAWRADEVYAFIDSIKATA